MHHPHRDTPIAFCSLSPAQLFGLLGGNTRCPSDERTGGPWERQSRCICCVGGAGSAEWPAVANRDENDGNNAFYSGKRSSPNVSRGAHEHVVEQEDAPLLGLDHLPAIAVHRLHHVVGPDQVPAVTAQELRGELELLFLSSIHQLRVYPSMHWANHTLFLNLICFIQGQCHFNC